MRSFLLQPYPFGSDLVRKLLVCAGVGLFVCLFLALFQPFGFSRLDGVTRWQHVVFFGAITFGVSSFVQIVIPLLFPALFKEEAWRSWKEILFLLFTTACIGAGNLLAIDYLYPQSTYITSFWEAQLITLQVGIFPVAFLVFMKQMVLYRRYIEEASTVNEDIHSPADTKAIEMPAEELLRLRGEGQKEELAILPQHLFFIASADNYVRVLYRKEGKPESVLIRSTLKKMEEQLAAHPHFFRCHRMYLVNLQLVENVSGNAQGLKLHLQGLEEPIPVSRSLTQIIKDRLHLLSHSPKQA